MVATSSVFGATKKLAGECFPNGTRTLNEAMVKGFLAIDFLKARQAARRPQFRVEVGRMTRAGRRDRAASGGVEVSGWERDGIW